MSSKRAKTEREERLALVIEGTTDGKPYRMVGSHTDITERKQAEEALRQSENRFSLAFHASPVPMIMTAPLDDARYVEVR